MVVMRVSGLLTVPVRCQPDRGGDRSRPRDLDLARREYYFYFYVITWYRSSSRSATGTEILGTTGSTYPVVPDDVGNYIRVVASLPMTQTATLTAATDARESNLRIGLSGAGGTERLHRPTMAPGFGVTAA